MSKMRRTARMLGLTITACLPGAAKRAVYCHVFGYDIHRSATIRPCILDAARVRVGEHARIGHFTVIRNLPELVLEDYAIIGPWNWITCGEFFTSGASEIERPKIQGLFLGPRAALTSRRAVAIRDYCYVGSNARFVPGDQCVIDMRVLVAAAGRSLCGLASIPQRTFAPALLQLSQYSSLLRRISWVGCALGLAMLAGALVPFVNTDLKAMLLICSTVVAVLPLIYKALRGDLDIFEPLVLFNVTFLLLFVFRPLSQMMEDNYTYTGIDISATFMTMIKGGLIAISMFVVAYLSPLGRRLSSHVSRPPRLHSDTTIALSVMIGAVVILATVGFYASTGGLSALNGRSAERFASISSTTSYVSESIAILIPVSLLLLGSGGGRPNFGSKTLAISVLLLFMVFTILPGDRRWLLAGALSLFVYICLSTRKRPLLLIVLFAIMAFPVSGAIRQVRTDEGGSLTGHLASIASSPMREWQRLMKSEDTGMAPAMAAEMTVIPERDDYWYGRASLLDIAIRPIPRTVWQDKPISGRLSVLQTLWGPNSCQFGGQCSTFSSFGDFYLDGGLVGIGLGAALLGLLWRTLYEYWKANQDSFFARVLYATLFPFAFQYIRGGFADMTSYLLFMMIPFAVIVVMATRRDNREATGSVDPFIATDMVNNAQV